MKIKHSNLWPVQLEELIYENNIKLKDMSIQKKNVIVSIEGRRRKLVDKETQSYEWIVL